MAKQVVNTERIASAANKLRTVNNNINNAFSTMQNKARQLDNNWKSAAGDAARITMYEIFKFNDSKDGRPAVLQNYINMLEQQVNPGYINTETTNKKLADNFK